MTRFRVALVALVLAGLAAWGLAGLRAPTPSEEPGHPTIDAVSRGQLDDVLRDSRESP